MKLLGEIGLFVIWGVLSLLVLPMIAELNLAGQIVFTVIWIGVLLATLFLYDLRARKTESKK